MSATNEIVLDAIQVTQPIGTFFISSISAKQLVEISYSDFREFDTEIDNYLGIQRPLKQDRVRQIRSYIQENRDASFPTSVILAVDEKCAEYDSEKKRLILHPYFGDEEKIPLNSIAKVLDGQHRIAGFVEEINGRKVYSFDRDFEINVSIFVGIDLPEQAKIFATVNLAQTKVNKSLVYDLEDLAKKRNPYKTCHHVAVALDTNSDSPFHKRIRRLGIATPGRNYEPITQAAFVESLVRFISDNPSKDRALILKGKKIDKLDNNKFPFRRFFEMEEDGDLQIYLIIKNYFEAVRNKWPNAWAQTGRQGSLLTKSNAFRALMRFLRLDVYNAVISESGQTPSPDDFAKYFDKVSLTDGDFTTKTFAPGSSGESLFYKVLRGDVAPAQLFLEE